MDHTPATTPAIDLDIANTPQPNLAPAIALAHDLAAATAPPPSLDIAPATSITPRIDESTSNDTTTPVIHESTVKISETISKTMPFKGILGKDASHLKRDGPKIEGMHDQKVNQTAYLSFGQVGCT